jgi:hypothetical protein
MVEYAILLALIALVSISVISLLGTTVKNSFQVANCVGPGQGSSSGNGGGGGGGIGGGTGGGQCQGG